MLRVFFKSAFFKSLAHCQRHLEYLDKQGPLFDGKREVPLHLAKETAEQFADAPKWWFVFSLDREDQQRLQVDRDYLQDLMEAQKTLWAKAYNIPPDHLHICASFHDVAHHPHIHVVLHGETASDGYVVCRQGQDMGQAFKRCRETVKSAIANEIYREDTQHLKVEKNQQRQTMNQELEKLLLEIGRNSHPVPDKIQTALSALAADLAKRPGKHQYGYLPPALKLQVDEVLREIVASDRQLKQLFEAYEKTQAELVKYEYVGKEETLAKKMTEWEKSFFHPAKGQDTRRHNLIIQAAENFAQWSGALPFGEATMNLDAFLQGAETTKRKDREHNKKKREMQKEALHTLEREMSGKIPREICVLLSNATPNDKGWASQPEATKLQIKAVEKMLFSEMPDFEETAVELAKLEKEGGDGELDGREWLHRRVLQYAKCIDVEKGIIDFKKLKQLRAQNTGGDYLLLSTVRQEVIKILDEHEELRLPAELMVGAGQMEERFQKVAELCMEVPAVKRAIQGSDERKTVSKVVSEIRETLQEYEPLSESEQEDIGDTNEGKEVNGEVLTALYRARAELEKQLSRSATFQQGFGRELLRIKAELNPTVDYKYATLPPAVSRMVDDLAKQMLGLDCVRKYLPNTMDENVLTEPAVLQKWILEYVTAATSKCPVDMSVPAKRRARRELLIAFDTAVCTQLNNRRKNAENQQFAEKCLGGKRISKRPPEPIQCWMLNEQQKKEVDDWIERLSKENKGLAKAINQNRLLFGESAWLENQLAEKQYLQNIVLDRLMEWREHPEKIIMPRFRPGEYKSKTMEAVARNMLYFISTTIRDDTLRCQGRLPNQPGRTKFKKKRIHKRTVEERREEFYR